MLGEIIELRFAGSAWRMQTQRNAHECRSSIAADPPLPSNIMILAWPKIDPYMPLTFWNIAYRFNQFH